MSDIDDDQDGAADEQSLETADVPTELDEHGQKAWLALTPALRDLGRLKVTDRAAMTRYCDMVGRYWKMALKVRDEGEVILVPTIAKDAQGNPGQMHRRHPLLGEMRAMLPELRQIEDRFGMSPLSRANLVNRGMGRGAPPQPDLPLGGDAPPADGDNADPARFH